MGIFPLGVEVGCRTVVAFRGVGVVVAEQAAENLERLLEQRLSLGVLPLIEEVNRQPGVASSGVGLVVGEQALENLNRLLEQGLGCRVFPLGVKGYCLLIHGIGRSVRGSILVRPRGHPA